MRTALILVSILVMTMFLVACGAKSATPAAPAQPTALAGKTVTVATATLPATITATVALTPTVKPPATLTPTLSITATRTLTRVVTAKSPTIKAPTVVTRTKAVLTPTKVMTVSQVALPTRAAPTSTTYPSSRYSYKEERVIGPYAIRTWRGTASERLGFDNTVTVAALGQPLLQIESVNKILDLTGKDINGNGTPDLVVQTFSGGAHCCYTTVVYDLGPTPLKIMETPPSNCAGQFKDLNGDGKLEFVTCDDLFAYAYCTYATSPKVTVIFEYDPATGYQPASPKFVKYYAQDIAEHKKLAEKAKPGSAGEDDRTTKCSVLPVVLDYLYSGDAPKAWSEFQRLYTFPDAATFRAEIERKVSESPLYVR
jgi:hypothetical protein